MRRFESGATRDSEEDKLDYEGFFSPRVLRRRAEYMHEHRIQVDGELRPADNWQKGIPPQAYMKSLVRHFFHAWEYYRGDGKHPSKEFEDALCAICFNAEGLLYELSRYMSEDQNSMPELQVDRKDVAEFERYPDKSYPLP